MEAHPIHQRTNGLSMERAMAERMGTGLAAAIHAMLGARLHAVSDPPTHLRLLGPDMAYHRLDPGLTEALAWMGLPPAEAGRYRQDRGDWFLCLEDCWTGPFLAQLMAARPAREDLVLLHVDDHTDMMPTFLSPVAGSAPDGPAPLRDPMTDRPFDPWVAGDWDGAIASGVVGIGSFLTPFLHGARRVHIRHLVNRPNGMAEGPIGPGFVTYSLLPAQAFAGVARGPDATARGSYRAAMRPDDLLRDLPAGRFVVHLDLDYFVNDFNGNPGQPILPEGTATSPEVVARMDGLFAALAGRPVAGWAIATSPGFCAARHWRALLAALSDRISAHRDGGAA